MSDSFNDRVRLGAGPAALMKRRDPFVLVEGPAGTGKSRADLTMMVLDGLKYPNSRILITRATRESLTESLLVTLEDEVFPSLGITVPSGADRQNRSKYRLDNGTVIVAIGLNKPERSYSTQWDRILVGEAFEVPKETAMKLARALRGTAMPYQQCVFETNPVNPNHWLNQIAEPIADELRHVETRAEYRRLQRFNYGDPPAGKWKRIVTKHQDNPAYFDHEAWRFRPFGQDYIDNKLGMMEGYLRLRLKDGLWVAASGTVYPEFRVDRHVVPPFPDGSPPPEWPCFVGWDPGYDHPTAILWFCVAPDGVIFVFDEIYRGGADVDVHCASVRAKNAGRTVRAYFGDPQDFFNDRSNGPSCAKQARACGLRFQRWPRTGGDAQAMVGAVRQLLRKEQLLVTSNCINTIDEFQSWSYRRTASGDVPAGDDAYEDANNHAMDVVKGLVATGRLKFRAPNPDEETD